MSIESAKTWLRDVADELDELWAGITEGEAPAGDDTWRILVLAARLSHAAPALSAPTLPADWTEETPDGLVAAVYQTDDAELLEALDEHIASREDPRGPLLDVVLDISDTSAVSALLGRERAARELSERASTAISQAPERFVEFRGLAAMRSAALKEDAPERALWQAVAHASTSAPAVRVLAGITPLLARQTRAVLPREWAAMAAHSDDEPADGELRGDDGQVLADWYVEEDGVRWLCIPYDASEPEPTSCVLELVHRETGSVVASRDLLATRKGNYAYVDLGHVAGPDNRIRALVEEVSASLIELSIEVRLKV